MPVIASSASAYGAPSRNDIKKIEYFFPTPKFIPFWSAIFSAVTTSWSSI
jgi:hypothetical protein